MDDDLAIDAPALAAPPARTPAQDAPGGLPPACPMPGGGADEPLPAQSPFHIVINVASGGHPDRALSALMIDALAGSGRRLHWYPVDTPSRVGLRAAQAAVAARREQGVVVAVGGDGTINAVAQQAIALTVPMAVLPRGTFNLFARAHGLPLEPQDAVRALRDRRTRRVPVGWVNDQPFLVNASLGLHPDLLDEREQDTRRFGRHRLVAIASGFAHVLHRRRRLQLALAWAGREQRLLASTLFVTVNAVQLASMGLRDADERSPPGMHALVLPPLGPAAIARLGWHALRGRLREADGVQDLRLDELTVRSPSRRRLKLAIDGEVGKVAGPLRFRCDPRGLRLVGGPDDG